MELVPPHNLPYNSVKNFVGRDRDLEILHQKLQTSKENVVIYPIVIVTGTEGIGKTELALQYALSKKKEKYYLGGICWLEAREENLGIQIIKYAKIQLNLNPPDNLTIEDQVAYCWNNWNYFGDILIVFDEVISYENIAAYLPPNTSQFKIIITTKLPNLAEQFESLDLEILCENSAIELLGSLIGSSRLEKELELGKAICRLLGYLPLSLQLVGHYLAVKPDLSLLDMQQGLEQEGLQQQDLFKQTNITTAKIAVRAALKLSWRELSQDALELACLLSLFQVAPISWTLVERFFLDEDKKDLDNVRDTELIKLNLLRRTQEQTYQLHELVQQFFQNRLEQMAIYKYLKREFCQTMVIEAEQIPHNSRPIDIERVSSSIPHIVRVATEFKTSLKNEDLIALFVRLEKFYSGQRADDLASLWRSRCLTEAKNHLQKEHPDVATSLNHLACLYDSQGRYREAELLYLQALELRKKHFGVEHPLVATSLNNLGYLYHLQGRYREAEPLYLQALTMRQKLLGSEHPSIATSLNNLACLYDSQGRYREAEPLYLQALKLRQKLLGSEHPSVATSLNNLASLYRSQSRYREAEPLYLQALNIAEKTLVSNHTNTITIRKNLEFLAQKKSNFNKESI